jgi:hypothetical protein
MRVDASARRRQPEVAGVYSLRLMTSWPTIELVHLPFEPEVPASDQVLEAAATLMDQGVPQKLLGGRYQASPVLTLVTVDGRAFLRFGTELGLPVCADVGTGTIVTISRADPAVGFVNSSLRSFIETARAVTARFPFYGEDDPDEQSFQAADDVADLIRSIEDRALERDGFWETLVEDIRMGDFVTEWLLHGMPGTDAKR